MDVKRFMFLWKDFKAKVEDEDEDEEEIKSAFRAYDINGDGYITKDEMVQVRSSAIEVYLKEVVRVSHNFSLIDLLFGLDTGRPKVNIHVYFTAAQTLLTEHGQGSAQLAFRSRHVRARHVLLSQRKRSQCLKRICYRCCASHDGRSYLVYSTPIKLPM